MRRRALLALPAIAAAPVPARPADLRFRVIREGSPIGTHQVLFSLADGVLTARTEVDIVVKRLGITFFRFSHRFEEDWADGRLRRATSRLDRNGHVVEMTARAEAGAILVRGPDGLGRLPAEAAPLSWWDSARLAGPLFANDTGQPLALRWSHQALPGGGTLWRATGEEESEGSYAADGTWIGWKTKAEDGSIVTYERA